MNIAILLLVLAQATDTNDTAKDITKVSMPCVVTRVIDGDTVELVTLFQLNDKPFKFHGRLLDCWAKDHTENDRKAADFLRTFEKKPVNVVILLKNHDMSKVLTLNRVLVTIFSTEGMNVNEEIVKNGWATKKKE